MSKPQRKQIELCGLWRKVDKNGNEFFVGSWNNNSIMIFANNHKTKDSHPDFRLFIAENEREKKPESDGGDGLPF